MIRKSLEICGQMFSLTVIHVEIKIVNSFQSVDFTFAKINFPCFELFYRTKVFCERALNSICLSSGFGIAAHLVENVIFFEVFDIQRGSDFKFQ